MDIQIKDLSYSYKEKEVLNNINLMVEKGKHIGIVGESGGGKSTFLKLVSGLYSIQSGSLIVAGESTPSQIRKKVAMVMQSNVLFPVSIKENITCGHSMTDERIMNACQAARLWNWIETLPEGLDTYVGESGSYVSGGQAQRISIARAIAKNAEIILLDEATSALDEKTGKEVLEALKILTKNKTVINVSHRKETLTECDYIYRLIGGTLECIGTL